MAKISFDLVSPENLIFNDEVGMIIVPGKDGDIGVLPGHSKLLSSLRPGRVMVYGEDKNLLKSFFVSGGFVEVNPEKCIVLAEEVQEKFDENFEGEIAWVIGEEWHGGNLSYHLKSRPKWAPKGIPLNMMGDSYDAEIFFNEYNIRVIGKK